MEGIKKLNVKNCNITFVEFPYHPLALAVENKSAVKPLIENFKLEVLKLFQYAQFDSLKLDTSKILMHDLSHLNNLGANELTTQLIKKMKKDTLTTIYIVNNGSCY